MHDKAPDFRNNPGMRFFFTMNRLRRAWVNAMPTGQLTKSQAITLITLCHHTQPEHKLQPDDVDATGGKQEAPPAMHCFAKGDFAPMTLSVLAKQLKQSMPAVSQRVAVLEENGFVQRKPDEKDRRTVWISITQKGIDALKESHTAMEVHMSEMVTRVGEEKIDEMLDVLDRVASSLEGYSGQQQGKPQ